MIKKYIIFLMIILSSLLYGGELKEALFAGGCFWSMEKSFEKIDGVESVISGYVGDSIPDLNDKNYGKGEDIEVIQITYDPSIISYEKLLKVYWKQVDPTDGGGQFVDRGYEYSTAIFYSDSEQKEAALSSKLDLEIRGVYEKSIVTPILEAAKFYPAKEYHQDYSKKNPVKYEYSRNKSGRDEFLDEIWGKDRKDVGVRELKNKLTDLEFKVTQEDFTEPPFKNEYWDNKKDGIYVDIISGEPLFSSKDKYESGTGWPSFTKPLVVENIVEKKEKKLLRTSTEIRSKAGNSHLGHVFNDGPKPSGLRYCMNSASLRFIPLENLKKEGYSKFEKLF